MNRTTIYHSERFDVVSYGNGLSYAIHDKISRKSGLAQGEDAAILRDELEAFERAFPERPYDEFYAEQLSAME